MTKAHSGSLLPIKNGIIIPIEYEDTLFPFYWNKVSGRGHEPITDVSTIVTDDKFGYALAVEDGTTNIVKNGDFSTGDFTGWSVWSAYGNTLTAEIISGDDISKYAVKLQANEGTCQVYQNIGKLDAGAKYTFSHKIKYVTDVSNVSYKGLYFHHSYSDYNGTNLDSDGATNSVLKSSGADWSNVESGMYIYAENGLQSGIQESGDNSDFAGYVQSVSSTTVDNGDGTTSIEWSIVLDRQLASGTYTDYRIRHRDDRRYFVPEGTDINKRGWQSVSYTITAPTHPWYSYTTTNQRGHSGSGVSWEMHVTNIQVEKKPWSTSFVNGTRADGLAEYNKDLFPQKDFTINMWVKSTGDTREWTTAYRLLSLGSGTYDNRLNIWVGRRDSSSSPMFIAEYGYQDGTTSRQCTDLISNSTNTSRVWNMVTITFDYSTKTYRLYMNGELFNYGYNGVATLDGKGGVVVTTVNPVNKFELGNSGFQHSNLMISPRVWSDQAIKAIYEYGRPLYDPMNYYSVYGG